MSRVVSTAWGCRQWTSKSTNDKLCSLQNIVLSLSNFGEANVACREQGALGRGALPAAPLKLPGFSTANQTLKSRCRSTLRLRDTGNCSYAETTRMRGRR